MIGACEILLTGIEFDWQPYEGFCRPWNLIKAVNFLTSKSNISISRGTLSWRYVVHYIKRDILCSRYSLLWNSPLLYSGNNCIYCNFLCFTNAQKCFGGKKLFPPSGEETGSFRKGVLMWCRVFVTRGKVPISIVDITYAKTLSNMIWSNFTVMVSKQRRKLFDCSGDHSGI